VVIGFNWIIDRVPIQRLLTVIGSSLDRGSRKFTLCITCPGGSTEQAFYAYEILRSLPEEVEITTHNVGSIQSAGVTLFLAGKTRLAVPNATFMVHETTHNTGGMVGVDHVEYGAAAIKADDASAMAIVAERTGKDLKTVRRWFGGQKLRDTEFARAQGFISDVVPVFFPAVSQFVQIMGV
jgi:ATP-dependent protease ClpP protease subunit